METPEESRELNDVTIRVRETWPRSFRGELQPDLPDAPARQGFTVDTRRGVRGKTLAQVLDWAEGVLAPELLRLAVVPNEVVQS